MLLYAIALSLLSYSQFDFSLRNQIWLSQKCQSLETLVIREVISTTSLLLIVSGSPNLRRLIVRRNAIRRRFDCGPRNACWSAEFYEWLKKTSIDYEATFRAVGEKLGCACWTPLSDEQFSSLRPKHQFWGIPFTVPGNFPFFFPLSERCEQRTKRQLDDNTRMHFPGNKDGNLWE